MEKKRIQNNHNSYGSCQFPKETAQDLRLADQKTRKALGPTQNRLIFKSNKNSS